MVRVRGSKLRLEEVTVGHQPCEQELQAAFAKAAPSDVDYLVELWVSRAGERADSFFYCRIATPEALASGKRKGDPFLELDEDALISSRGTVVVARLDWRELREYLGDIVAKSSAISVSEGAPDLQRFFVWEYDDYDGGPRTTDPSGRSFCSLSSVELADGAPFRALYPWQEAEVDYEVILTVSHLGSPDLMRHRLRIVTPQALLLQSDKELVLAHEGTAVVRTFEWRTVLDALKVIVARCGVESVSESRWRLRRFFRDVL